MSMLHWCSRTNRSSIDVSFETSTGVKGNASCHGRGGSAWTFGHGIPTRRFLNFFVASRYRNGLSTDFPKTGSGTTQWQSISMTGQIAFVAIRFTQSFQGGSGNKSVMMMLAHAANSFRTGGRCPSLAMCRAYSITSCLHPLCKSMAASRRML